ncbi:MAG: FAD-dependent oxidoreductase [Puniceicoccales bacterium]|jgi:protoporphyrinogen oxidase|nr:FAD-dependent oxidoreductase [Puniceicoccales bacterium]
MSDFFVENLILGGGLSGLSASYHLGHENCLILEKEPHLFGLLASRRHNGFTWDNGPHVSFTKHDHVRSLFARSTRDEFWEIPVNVGNFFHGNWVRHPAQVNLAQVPEPLRSACVASLEQAHALPPLDAPENYQQWLETSLGKTFAENFSAPYTRKYWTVPPSAMSCDWVGGRVHRPRLEDVRAGAESDIPRNLHYIDRIRYPKTGGYQSFSTILAQGANVRLGARATAIDLAKKEVCTQSGETLRYSRLVSTIPLTEFVEICVQSTSGMREAARGLLCSSLVLADIELRAPTRRPEHWLYVYNEDFLSTRIHFIEKLSPANAPDGHGGVQVEIYHQPQKKLPLGDLEIGRRVVAELDVMGILPASISSSLAGNPDSVKLTRIPFANVVFLSGTSARLEAIWDALQPHGLSREPMDTHPLVDWSLPPPESLRTASLLMAGRFAQWKYFWTDDCVLRGKALASQIK